MAKILSRACLRFVVVPIIVVLTTGLASAATTDFVADGNVTVSNVVYGSLTADLLIMNDSRAESWTFDSDNFTVINPDPSATFKVGSSNASVKSIRVRSGGSEVTCADNTTPGTSYVTVPTVGSYAVFPSAALCDADGGTTSTGGGGGGGRPRSNPPPTPPVPANPTPAALALIHASPNAAFFRPLSLGSTGDDVRSLQQFLNGRGFTVAIAGPGSSGNETTYFGPATRTAVVKFQIANDVIPSATAPGAGNMGPLTTAKINELIGGAPASGVAPTDREALIQSLRTQIAELTAIIQAMLQAQATGQGN